MEGPVDEESIAERVRNTLNARDGPLRAWHTTC